MDTNVFVHDFVIIQEKYENFKTIKIWIVNRG